MNSLAARCWYDMHRVSNHLLDIGEVRVRRELGHVANVLSEGQPIPGLL